MPGSDRPGEPGISDKSVISHTGHDWKYWRNHLDTRGAAAMEHGAIVRVLEQAIDSGWWRQMVAVGYERMIGKRVLGQKCTGEFSTGVSLTLPLSMDAARDAWIALIADRVDYAGALASGEPRLSQSAKWRYWRIDLDDGSKVSVNICEKPGGKALLSVDHGSLADSDCIAAVKPFWKSLLAQL